ncbi:ribosomal protein S5 domain 2-type protein [Globomyces pollinis-pini]|nr:ribosomal protein S5 domain 2-type protein [Globomyces pollinis-pini]
MKSDKIISNKGNGSILLDSIPTINSNELQTVYSSSVQNRILSINNTFKNNFDCVPQFYVRSPGRVNLIGEHIDYSGYSVLPMAIERDTIMAISAIPSTNPTIELVNTVGKYSKAIFNHEESVHVTIDSSIHEWTNYFKCGYKGVLDRLNPTTFYSMKIVVSGTVPTGSGLSSSSSLVCCSALATLHAHRSAMTKGELSQTAIECERLVGVHGGGMDQSISIMASNESALLIDFHPKLDATPVILPKTTPEFVFIIANTLVTADKHVTAPIHYNLRVVECRLISLLLCVKLKLTLPKYPITLKQVEQMYFDTYPSNLNQIERLDKLNSLVQLHINPEPYTMQQISNEIGIDIQTINDLYIRGINIRAHSFQLFKRAIHVYSEAQRVYEFQQLCHQQPSTILSQLGQLMNESHESCRDYFDCSCDELDELTQLARSLGAYGSRLTGAGWGGCTVSLVSVDHATTFISKLREQYYAKHFPDQYLDDAFIESALFATKPCIGALIVDN